MSPPRQSATYLPTDTLHPHPDNIRAGLGDLNELAASIRHQGIIQPLVVTEHPTRDGHWLILAGHRRHAAAGKLGLPKVPCVIRHGVVDPTAHVELMLVENIQRRDLGPVEKAEAIGVLINHGLSQTDVARRLGITSASVNYYTTLLDLDADALEAVRHGELGVVEAVDAVRAERMRRREEDGQAKRGRPTVVEPRHFTRSHPLYNVVRARCDHTRRMKVASIACGECWEQAIRDDVLGLIDPSEREPQPPKVQERRQEIDEVAVQRRIDGDHTTDLNVAEKREAVRILHARGLNDHEIARTIGYTARTIDRIRNGELGLPHNYDAGQVANR